MSFIAAMNATAGVAAQPKTKVGVNGEHVLTEAGVGDVRVSLFAMLTRTLSASYIAGQVRSAPVDMLTDLLVMAMQTRDIRGGKGERDLFYAFLEALVTRAPAAVEALIPLVPEYGCWRDLWELHERLESLQPAIESFVRRQWTEDSVRADGKRSLLAKWLPREGSKTYPGLAARFAKVLFPEVAPRMRMATYRKAVADANRMLKTVEVKMCAGQWATIEPAHVPGRCFKVKRAALMNKKLKKIPGQKTRKPIDEERVGSEDRRACAVAVAKFLEKVMAGKATIKGADTVYPHELVRSVSQFMYRQTAEIDPVVEAQWRAIRESTAKAGGFGKAVAMCDFSGSMSGLPMEVSLALGILISETNHPMFRDHILTFDSDPRWHSFVGLNSLQSKVMAVYNKCGQGLSTDFYRACMLILDRMKEEGVPVGEEPQDLIVLTDMGWDAAHKGHGGAGSAGRSGYSTNTKPWKSQIANIRDKFADHGYTAPRIVIWNLRAEYKDFHAAAEDEGVVMISGWSPAILTALTKDGVQTRTPLEALRAVLDAPRYDAVRAAIREPLEGKV